MTVWSCGCVWWIYCCSYQIKTTHVHINWRISLFCNYWNWGTWWSGNSLTVQGCLNLCGSRAQKSTAKLLEKFLNSTIRTRLATHRQTDRQTDTHTHTHTHTHIERTGEKTWRKWMLPNTIFSMVTHVQTNLYTIKWDTLGSLTQERAGRNELRLAALNYCCRAWDVTRIAMGTKRNYSAR